MRKIKIKNNKGILFWITGYSGSGKTEIAKVIHNYISKKYGPTILFNGDDLRKILNLHDYSLNGRLDNGYLFSKLFKFITNQKINIIFAGMGLFHKLQNYNKKNIKNYVEIYVKTNLKRIIRLKKKIVYLNNQKNIVGLDIKAELPKNPNIIIKNNFKIKSKILAMLLIKRIEKVIY